MVFQCSRVVGALSTETLQSHCRIHRLREAGCVNKSPCEKERQNKKTFEKSCGVTQYFDLVSQILLFNHCCNTCALLPIVRMFSCQVIIQHSTVILFWMWKIRIINSWMIDGRLSSSNLTKTIVTGHYQVAGSIPVWGSEIVFLRFEVDERPMIIHSNVKSFILFYSVTLIPIYA